jgi:UDP-N-acetylmuramyl pentapeptide phosphotransferase/UDP-N-acetylglucosamine-1-phosphate transferase
MLGGVVAVVWIVAVCNFFNFLDGIDGYAGTQAILAGFGFLLLGRPELTVTVLALIGACAAFLLYNWHPAKVFMGDSGSGALGFLLATLPFSLPTGPRESSVFAAGLFLWFFLSDGVYTLGVRLFRREKIWTPHRGHLYQRLVTAGIAHNAVVLRVGSVAAVLILLVAMSFRSGVTLLQWVCLLAGVLCFVAYLSWTRFQEARFSAATLVAAPERHERAFTQSTGY